MSFTVQHDICAEFDTRRPFLRSSAESFSVLTEEPVLKRRVYEQD